MYSEYQMAKFNNAELQLLCTNQMESFITFSSTLPVENHTCAVVVIPL